MKTILSLLAFFLTVQTIAAIPPQDPEPTSVQTISGGSGWVMGTLSMVGYNRLSRTVVWRCKRSTDKCILLLRNDDMSAGDDFKTCSPLTPYVLSEKLLSSDHKYTVGTYENGKLTLTPADEIKTECTDGDVTVYVTTY